MNVWFKDDQKSMSFIIQENRKKDEGPIFI